MSQSTLTVRIAIDGIGRIGLAVLLSDPTGAYGVKRNDTDAAVVADGTAMNEIGGGYYAHTFTDPAPGLSYTGWVEYTYEGETYHASHTFTGVASDAAAAPPARRWESIIPYESRGTFHTSRWRLLGVSTGSGAQNTGNGVLWLTMTRAGDTVTAELFKDDGLAPADKVASGTADVSGTDGTGDNAAHVVLAAANDSGLSGEFWIHRYLEDGTCPIQVALCTDEDLDALWDGIENLAGYDATCGMAEFIRIAGEDVLGRVATMLPNALGGYGATEAWFINDASRGCPDLRRIANPAQLRQACAYRALEIGIGRDHQ
ncbi:MAG: hypothetical protein E4H18_01075, partial [Hyphomicrobiales bacterium]